jgi:O-antigen ligase
MKQMLFLIAALGAGFFGGFIHPAFAFAPYYLIAVLQPHELWAWSLPQGVQWSFTAGVIALFFFGLHLPFLFHRVRPNLVSILMIAYGVLLGMSVINAHNPAIAEHWFIIIAKTLLIALLLSLVIERWSHVVLLCGTIFLATTLLAWHFNSLYFFDGRVDILFHGLGSFDNNGAALLMLMGLPFAYAFFFGFRSLWLRLGAGFVGAMTIHAVMLSYSRGAMLAGLIGMGYLASQHRPRWHLLWAAPLVAIALSVMAGNEVRSEFATIRDAHQTDASAQSRLNSWRAAWEIAWDNPILGVGVRNANRFSFNYGADIPGRTIHNQYLQLAADAGFPCLIVYISMIGLAFWRARVARRMLEAAITDHPAMTGHDTDDPARPARIAWQTGMYARLMLAVEMMIVTFAAGAMFLSLETFELVLLAAAIGGVAPRITREYLDRLTPAACGDTDSPPPPVPDVAPADRPHLTPALGVRP